MKRNVSHRLEQWKTSPDRKPLLLFGARQVGKTYSLRHFGAQAYENVAYVDFARDTEAASIFEGSLNPANLISQLGAYLRMDILPGRTLIVLDEVQLCERALTALKYFCDEAPEQHVIAAGSLLGVRLRRERSLFPVGKVDMLTLHPMSFDEYLTARGEERLSGLIAGALSANERFSLHARAMDLYREYLLVGGMPEVVAGFVGTVQDNVQGAYALAQRRQLEIEQAYLADIAKYAPSAEMPRISEAWRSVPGQLAKENHKFQYRAIRSGGRAGQYEASLAWLEATGTVVRCVRVSEAVAPLVSFADPGSFKLYMADTGLLSALYQAVPSDVRPEDNKAAHFRGSLAENYVMQQLSSRDVAPNYWGTPSKAEVEFVVRDAGGGIVPIEVKSGSNVRSTSLGAFCRAYDPLYSIRVSARNFGFEGDVRSVPLYAVCYLADELSAARSA